MKRVVGLGLGGTCGGLDTAPSPEGVILRPPLPLTTGRNQAAGECCRSDLGGDTEAVLLPRCSCSMP